MTNLLDLAQLNRATLARQGLLERSDTDVVSMVERVFGLQAQRPGPPFTGLWSRIESFDRGDLLDAIHDGRLVRGTLMRATLHLWSTRDYRALRSTVRPNRDMTQLNIGRGVDMDVLEPALDIARAAYADGHHTAKQVRELVRATWPDIDEPTLRAVIWGTGPLLMQHVEGQQHGYPNVAGFTDANRMLDGPIDPVDRPELLLRRYLASFGPATVLDAQAWSGRTGLGPAVRAMLETGELIEVDAYDGRTMVDLVDAPRPPGETPAPVRYLPLWDTVLLGFKDRSRVYDPKWQTTLMTKNGIMHQAFLVDGFVHGMWSATHDGGTATLQLDPLLTIPRHAHDALVAEGEALLAFLHPEADRQVVRLG